MSIERDYRDFIRDGYHPLAFLFELSEHYNMGDRLTWIKNHSLSEITDVDPAELSLSDIELGPDAEIYSDEELIYSLLIQPIRYNQEELIEYLGSDLPSLLDICLELPFNMRAEIMSYIYPDGGEIYGYDEEPLYLAILTKEPDTCVYVRTSNIESPVFHRYNTLYTFTDEEKWALNEVDIFNKPLAKWEMGYLACVDGVPCVLSEDIDSLLNYGYDEDACEEVEVMDHWGSSTTFFAVPFDIDKHMDSDEILLPLFDDEMYEEDDEVTYYDPSEYYKQCLVPRAMKLIEEI